MKIILSRKGFDSGFGGCASPILPDGTMISLPIPDSEGNYSYEELSSSNGRYSEILQALNPKGNYTNCHLDPDIRKGIRKEPAEWVPAFGQIDAAQTHLENNNIRVGDLFLFFGWFRKTEYHNGTLRFIKNAPDIQVIYGYLQIGEIVKGNDVKKLPWHPHADDAHIFNANGEMQNNVIYVASQHLNIGGIGCNLPGAGVLPYSEKKVLTADGQSRSKWKVHEVFKNVNLTCHDREKCLKSGYFQSRPRGQEFIFDEDDLATNWAKEMILE